MDEFETTLSPADPGASGSALPGTALPDAASAESEPAPGLGVRAGLRARAERRSDDNDRRRGGERPAAVEVERRRADRRSGPKRTAGVELSPSGLSLALTIRDGSRGDGANEHADPHRKEAEFYGPRGFERFTAGARTVCRFRPWPPGCGPTEAGYSREALGELFAATAGDLGVGSLNGVPVDVALGGSLCVTRVLTAPHDDARRDAAALSERAVRYVGLGRGEKTCVTAEERLDAKTTRVRVTAALRHVAADILHVLTEAGLRAGRIEHTMATLSAGLHARGSDGDRPVLLLAAEGDRLNVAVAHRGRLLLDYRPVGHQSFAVRNADSAEAAESASLLGGEVLLRHQKRIRRYVANQLRGQPGGAQFFADAEAAEDSGTGLAAEMRVYVTGGASLTRWMSDELDPRPDLAVGPHPAPGGVDFAAASLDESAEAPAVWSVGAAVSPGPLAATLLACGATAAGEERQALSETRGDLAVAVQPHGGVPWAELARAGWPVVASLVLSLCMWGLALHAEWRQSPLEEAVQLTRTDADMAVWLRGKLSDAEELDRRASILSSSNGTGPAWLPSLVGAGSALVASEPDADGSATALRRAWIEEFRVKPASAALRASDGSVAEVQVVGGGHTDVDALAYANRLRASGRFAHVQLAATREARYSTGPGVRFELTAAPTRAALAARIVTGRRFADGRNGSTSRPLVR